jgi:HK97 family phage portal protein
MSLFAKAIVERRDLDASSGWDRYIKGILNQLRTASGVSVTPDAAMRVGVFFACVRLLAEDEAKLPLVTYRRIPGGGREPAPDFYLYDLLHRSPNPRMTSVELRETVGGHLVARGNGFIYKVLDGSGRILSMWPLRPDRMEVLEDPFGRDPGELIYRYTLPNGEQRVFSSDWIIHLRGFGNDGISGYSPITQAREAIGAAAAAEKYAASFFGNDATPRLVLKTKKSYKDENAIKNIRKSWEERFQGIDRRHLIAILEEDMDVETIGLSPEDSQLLTTREFSVEDIARWFRLPPHKVGHLKRSTFSNIEHQSLEYLTDSLLPWLVRWEQRLALDCLTEAERRTLFVEHKVEGLLRADFKTRMDGYRIAREMGLMSVNEIRQLENLNPIGPEGDVHHVPLNWIELGTTPELGGGSSSRTAELLRLVDGRNAELPPGDNPAPAGRRSPAPATRDAREDRLVELRLRLRKRFRPLIRKASQEIINRELADVGRAAEKFLTRGARDGGKIDRLFMERGRTEFQAWLEEFYRNHPTFIRDKLLPVLRAFAEAIADATGEAMGDPAAINEEELGAFVEDYLSGDNGRAEWHSGAAVAQLFRVLEVAFEEGGVDPLEAIREKLELWREGRVDQMTETEVVRGGGAFFVFMMNEFYQVQKWRWRAFGENCPYCSRLDGKVVASSGVFIAGGEAFGDDIEGGPLVPSFNVRHEPAHGGCDCMVVPEIGG